LGVRMPISDTWTVSESALSTAVSSTGGQTHRGGSALPFFVSAADTAHVNYAWVEAKAAGAISASALHKFTVFYTMDERSS